MTSGAPDKPPIVLFGFLVVRAFTPSQNGCPSGRLRALRYEQDGTPLGPT